MNQFFGYIRVSTAKQGEQGVSLAQQRDAIEQYAQRTGLRITRWFEEQETAAKRGRPIFSEMIRLLRRGQVRGVIIHKIDRSARNLRDWADLGELIDQGIEVHFANEALDLHSRGGRLSADIQAVVAADYVRNLREETRKGIYGRLKQGLYPMPAPVGYLDAGRGQPKTLDPARAPLIRQGFELYASSRFNLRTVADELFRLGLRSPKGTRMNKNRLSEVFNNPFYIGLIRIKRTGETFSGIHEPLIPKGLFNRVQAVLNGRTNTQSTKHDFLYRCRLTCKSCGYSLIGELQKSRVYYRCHTKECSTTCIREDSIDAAVLERLSLLHFTSEEHVYLRQEVSRIAHDDDRHRQGAIKALELRLGQIEDRMNRLTDAYIYRLIEKEIFEQRKTALLMERKDSEGSLAEWRTRSLQAGDRLLTFLERANSAYLAYETGALWEKRDLLDSITSNRIVDAKTLDITLALPFEQIAKRSKCRDGCPRRDVHRTWTRLLPGILTVLQRKQETQIQSAA